MFTIGNLGSPIRFINLAIIGAVVVILLKKRIPIIWGAGVGLWCLYGAWLFVTVIWSPNQERSFTFAVGMVFLISVFGSLLMLPYTERDLKLVKAAWLLMAGLAGGLFLLFGEKASYGDRTHVILPSGGSDPNEFSAYFVLPLALLLELVFKKKGISQILAIVSALGCLYIILMTGSRAGLIACFVVLVIIILRQKFRSPASLFTTGTFILLSSYILVNFIWPLVPEAVRERLSIEALLDDGGSSRDSIWADGLATSHGSVFNFIFGVGPHGAFDTTKAMHNHFLQTYVDAGLIGSIIFLLLLITVLRGSFQDPGVFAGIVGIVIMMMTLTAYSNFRVAWAVIFMGLLAYRMSLQHGKVSEKSQ